MHLRHLLCQTLNLGGQHAGVGLWGICICSGIGSGSGSGRPLGVKDVLDPVFDAFAFTHCPCMPACPLSLPEPSCPASFVSS